MVESKHLAIDLDDVCLDFYGTLIDAVNEQFDAELTRSSFEEWDLGPVLEPIIGGNWWKWWKAQDLWQTARPVRGVLGGLRHLRKNGYYLEVVTSKPEWAERATWEWQGRVKLPVHQFTIVEMGKRKVDTTDADILIDDKPANCYEFVDDGRKAILFSSRTAHESSAVLRPGMVRALRWAAIPTVLEALEYEEARSG